MDAVLRGSAVYLFLVLVFSLVGKRSLSQSTNFDFLFIIILGQCTQLALLGDDFSVTNSYVLVATLTAWHLGLAGLTSRIPTMGRWIGGGLPLVIVEEGRLLERRAARVDVAVEDVMQAARTLHGLERMDQIRYAVMERNGDISIMPR
jgi:uncharacterized membrane protein YcaP (DUF421 family)